MAPVKLQINSLAALERLIGGDSDLELEMRNSIVQEFSKKYLKGVAERICGNIESVARQECTKVAQNFLGKSGWNGYNYSFQLTSDAKEAIQYQVDLEIAGLVQEMVNKKDIEKIVQKEVDRRIDAQVKELVNQEVKEKLAEVVKSLKL